MSRFIVRSSTQYLSVASVPVSAVPLTMACWFYSVADDTGQTLMCISNTTTTNSFRLGLRGDEVGDPVEAFVGDTGGTADCFSTSGYSINTWHHASGLWIASDDMRVYIDGGSEDTDPRDRTPVDLDTTLIGRFQWGGNQFNSLDGRIAEAGIWNVSLAIGELAMLAAGYSPLFIRPQSLVFYLPCVRDNDEDIVGGLSLTAFNSPTIADHPPMIYPAPPIFYSIPSAVEDEMLAPKILVPKRNIQIPIRQLNL